ncbi:MAG: hypothetical protein IJ068_00440 [Bacilli bacterium]|nr:hypothetical protein [Bacilli bacterium]
MFDKQRENIIRKLAGMIYPNRDVNIVKMGNQFFTTFKDSLGRRNDYLLKGTYNYNQVIELNNLTGYNASFGFCKEIGPVAFIGIPNPDCTKEDGYFCYNVHEYGTSLNEKEYYFSSYNDEQAKGISNYTVYGMGDPRLLDNTVLVDKVGYIYDYRYKCKDSSSECYVRSVLRMDIKLEGTYNFYQARMMAYGSLKKPNNGYSRGQVPLQFAMVNGEPVGILNLWDNHDGKKFRDVWELHKEEPIELPMEFISDDEAKRINSFKLYIFELPYSFETEKYKIEKIDRTLERGFNFTMDDGTDYRLKSGTTKQKVLSKTL